MQNTRDIEIKSALEKLESFKKNPEYKDEMYAIEENIAFLKAIKNFPTYLKWLFFRAPKLDSLKLLELTDFPVEEWDVLMHKRLIEMQEKDRPGLVKPIVETITNFIFSQNSDVVMADLGAGGMELDHQIIKKILSSNFKHKIVMIAVDKSPTTQVIAKDNLKGIFDKIDFYEVENLDETKVESIKRTSQKKVVLILCKNDIFNLDKFFPKKYFNIIYHSLFKHHLPLTLQPKFDAVINNITENIFEYDGFRSWMVIIPQTIVGWNHPHFLNAELFSNFRFLRKKDILQYAEKCKGKVKFYTQTGQYLLIKKAC